MAPLTALLALKVGSSLRAARWAGLIVAFYPMLWLYPIGLASENLFTPLLLIGVLGLVWKNGRGVDTPALLTGLILGLATLTRSALVLFLPIAGVWYGRRHGVRRGIILTAAWIALLIPWSLRNSLILGRPSFIENTIGYNLFVGYHPEGDGGFQTEVAVIPLTFIDDGARDRWAMTQALDFIQSDPPRALKLILQRTAYFWGLEGRELIYFYSNNFFGPLPSLVLVILYLIVITPFAVVSLSTPAGMALQRGEGGSLIAGLIATTALAYVPILAEARFHVPLVPFLAVYAAIAWTAPGALGRLKRGLRTGDRAWLLAVAVMMLFMILWGWDLWRLWPRLSAVFATGGNELMLHY
jgi:hypothetical protein